MRWRSNTGSAELQLTVSERWVLIGHTLSPVPVLSGLHLAEGAVRRPVVFGEGLELQRVEGVLPAAHVLHSVLSPAAFAEETQQDEVRAGRHRAEQ